MTSLRDHIIVCEPIRPRSNTRDRVWPHPFIFDGTNFHRRQFPLRLAYSMTMADVSELIWFIIILLSTLFTVKIIISGEKCCIRENRNDPH